MVLAAALAVTALWGSPALAQTSEVIHSYDVAIEIRADDSIRVTEVIAYDFGSSPHHGIFRDVPTREAYDDRYDRVFPLHVESVEATGGASADYEVSQEPGGITRIKIGDPDETITGAHTYTIVYTVEAAMNGFRDHDELYWNAIGAYWEVPVETATATVSAPAPITDITCYAGPVSSTAPCDKARILEDGTARFRQSNLFPFEAFTVVAALPKGVVAEPKPLLVEPWSIGRAFSRTSSTLGLSGGCSCSWSRVRLAVLDARARPAFRRLAGRPDDGQRHRRGAGGAAVRARRRPGGVRAAGGPPTRARSGTIIDEQANTLDVTATIVDLAVRGYLTIEEIPKEGWFGKPDWTLHRTDKADDRSAHVRADAADRAVRGRQRPDAVRACKRTFSERLTKVEDRAVRRRRRSADGSLKRPDKVRASWHARGALLFVAGIVLTFVLARWTTFGLVGRPGRARRACSSPSALDGCPAGRRRAPRSPVASVGSAP